MTREEAKEYFRRIDDARDQLKKCEISIGRLRFELEHPLSGVDYSREKVSRTPEGSALENKVIKYMKLLQDHEQYYLQKKTELEGMLFEAECKIRELKAGMCRDYLFRRFIEGVKPTEYCKEVSYNDSKSVYQLQTRAFELFAAQN